MLENLVAFKELMERLESASRPPICRGVLCNAVQREEGGVRASIALLGSSLCTPAALVEMERLVRDR